MNISHYTNRAEQAAALAMLVADQLHTGIEQHQTARLAVPGGTTPAPFLQALGQISLDWSKVRVTLTDERQVPMDNARSNALLLRENLLNTVQGIHFLPLFDPAHAQNDMRMIAQSLQDELLPLDVCVLGMGTDGHFASLFPAADQLEAGLDPTNPLPVLVVTADNIPEARISLSLSALLSARHIHLLITGAEKLQVLEQAAAHLQAGAPRQWPVEALLQQANERLTIHYTP